ncbi:LysR substrate-binding domain-containing protein [Snodgrassella sp. M0351]|uniref:LysR substrate-binding domain-containing protein n=1 Tax=Snodgrassella sp. M0351 TaxID=2751012 RepID=UPI00351C52AC
MFASPEYLSENNIIYEPADIQNHKCINFSISQNNKKFSWKYIDKSTAHSNGTDQIHVFDSMLATKFLAINGNGIVQLFRFAVQEELQSGKLVEILPECSQDNQWEFCFLYPQSNKNSAKLRVFIDYFSKQIK